jgi:hypothetical protein
MAYHQLRTGVARIGMTALCASTLALAATTAASAAPLGPQGPPIGQNPGEICRLVVGLPTGLYTQYEACRESLSTSLAETEAQGRVHTTAATLPAWPATSYFSASNGEVHRREVAACAQIGDDPSTFANAQCVADLQSSLFDADVTLG